MKEIELSDRQLKILSAIVKSYIQNGEPVSSGTVYAVLKLDVCTSTIRSDMSELTAKGFLRKIHTSSGSIPSANGYRVYANRIANEFKGSNSNFSSKEHFLNFNKEPVSLNCECSGFNESLFIKVLEVVSKDTDCVAVLNLKSSKFLTVKNVRIIKISETSACVFVLFSSGEIKSEIIRNLKDLDADVLMNLENVLNNEFIGVRVKDIPVALIQKIAARNNAFSSCFIEILNEVYTLIKEGLSSKCYVSKIPRNMFKVLPSVSSVFSVYNFLEDKKLLERFILRNKFNLNFITVTTGKENAYVGLEDFSIVSSDYIGGENSSGRISLIGPMRMNYSAVIASLVYASSFLKKLLNKR